MKEKKKVFHFEEGELLLVDKPLGWTSFDVVNHLRVIIKKNLSIPKLKVGHAGTLDPLASGLLLLCTGKMTKQIQFLQDQEKVYTGTMKLGYTTPSYDLETEIDETFPTAHINQAKLELTRQQFLGPLEQLPPIYSAVKINGKRAFEYARKQKEVTLVPRKVEIFEFEIDPAAFPDVNFRIRCSKGTYIRSLVHDFGKALSSGAVLSVLRRTHSGPHCVANAWQLQELKDALLEMASIEKSS